jgi:hypothetical protein
MVLVGSASSDWHALGGNGSVQVLTSAHLAVRRVADRPQAAWTPADLRVVSGAGYLPGRSPVVRPLYDPLIACLEHRVGGEVRIASAAERANGCRRKSSPG